MATRTWEGNTDGDWETAGNWKENSVPTGGDEVVIPAGVTQAIDDGLDQSAVTLASFKVEPGCDIAIASADAYLQFAVSGGVELSGTGLTYIDIGASNEIIKVFDSATAGDGLRGLYLKGSDIDVLEVSGGSVGLAVIAGETSTVDVVRVTGEEADLWLGAGVTLSTKIHQTAGELLAYCAIVLINLYEGEFTIAGAAAMTTGNLYGGSFVYKSSGDITTLLVNGAEVDTMQSGIARTIAALKLQSSPEFLWDPSVVAVTDRNAPDHPVRETIERF